MTDPPDRRAAATAKAEHDLVRLNAQVTTMRAVLVHLLQDIVRAEYQVNSGQASQLLEANEQLVISALGAQADAEKAAGALDEATRSGGLDPLTELPNRARLLDRLEHDIAHARRYGHRLALLFLDLNGFKQINDAFGHAAGDRAIQLVADCLRSLVRGIDSVSRHGGDEFLILLAEISQAADAAVIAEKVNTSLRSYGRIDKHLVHLSASIGISIYPEDGEEAKSLIDKADAAMYVAKRQGLGGFAFYRDHSPGRSDMPELPIRSSQQRLTHQQLASADYELRHAQLREANEHLVVAALGAQGLQAAAEQARQQLAEILAVVAQELNSPFAPIRIAAAMLGRARTDGELLPRAQVIVERHVAQMSRLVSGLVKPAQVDEPTFTLDRSLVNVARIVDEVVASCQGELRGRLQRLEVAVTEERLEVHADPILLAQVVRNLLDNAMAYTHDGGRIRLSAAVVDDAVELIISDDGIGMSPEAMQTIFEPFVRDPRAGILNQDGLGIGLTAVRAIVEAHGGRVDAASAGRGYGSQFVVSLPLARAGGN